MKPKLRYIKPTAVRALAKELGRRTSFDFLSALDSFVGRKVQAACSVHNGGKKTLDASVAGYVGIAAPNVSKP